MLKSIKIVILVVLLLLAAWLTPQLLKNPGLIQIELLGYQPSEVIKMQFVTKKSMPWPPEPFRWIGIRLTQLALIRADRNGGKRGLWLKLLDSMGMGFTC